MNDNPLAALAMRERAAEVCKVLYETIYPYEAKFACEYIEDEIRAMPTTFTDAELLAAAMQLPEVRALVEAATIVGILSDWDATPLPRLRAALAPFMKGGERCEI